MAIPVFAPNPDPDCMFLTPVLKQAKKKINGMIQAKEGLACIFGDNGFGKSSLLRSIAGTYDSDERFKVAFLANKNNDISPMAFLRLIGLELDIPPQRSRMAQMVAMEEYLDEQNQTGKTVMVLIDEAQRLPAETMEVVRSLLNYETNTSKLCQIIMAGELTFRDRLMTKRYKAFKSRIVAPVVLELFTAQETTDMIAFRHERWGVDNKFTDAACGEIYTLTRGVPRDCVVLAGYAYKIAGEESLASIGPGVIQRAYEMMLTSSARESVEAAELAAAGT
jgi:type II secretory pathway predicted ATPase ExeA